MKNRDFPKVTRKEKVLFVSGVVSRGEQILASMILDAVPEIAEIEFEKVEKRSAIQDELDNP